MSLLEDVKGWYEYHDYPPGGSEINARQVDYESCGSRRWGTDILVTYRRDQEYVQLRDVEPATEMQDWGDYGKPEIYEAEPLEVIIIKYVRS